MILFYKQASIPSNALLASYKIAHIGLLILLAAGDMVNLTGGDLAPSLGGAGKNFADQDF